MFELSKMFLLCLNYWKLETPSQFRQRSQNDDVATYKVNYTRWGLEGLDGVKKAELRFTRASVGCIDALLCNSVYHTVLLPIVLFIYFKNDSLISFPLNSHRWFKNLVLLILWHNPPFVRHHSLRATLLAASKVIPLVRSLVVAQTFFKNKFLNCIHIKPLYNGNHIIEPGIWNQSNIATT